LCRPYGAYDRSCCLPTTYLVGFPMPPLCGLSRDCFIKSARLE
jgi:hypothetical protein